MHSTTWSTEGFHTIEMRRYKIIVGAARYIFPVKITFDKKQNNNQIIFGNQNN
jgi:hypothetical protein